MGNGITASRSDYSDLSGLSSDSEINAVLNGSRWGTGTGATVALTYSFIRTGSQFASNYTSSQEYRNSQPVTSAQQTAIRTALAAWSRVANITFTEVTETSSAVGDIRFGIFNGLDDQYGAWAYYPGGAASAGDVWYHRNTTTYNLNSGGYFIQLSLHELGHALGLKHSFDANDSFSGVTLPGATESDDWTVMSYTNSDYVYTITPQAIDIKAIQYLYGANTTTTAGNDSYSLGLADQTVWDYGGTDTLSAGSSSLTYSIDLRAGRASTGTNGSSTARYYIMSGVTIENATGSSGNDTITGNDADNTLTGGAGADVLNGSGGTDTAVYDGNYASYTVTNNGTTITVRDSSGTTDTLTNIEWLSFADQRVAGVPSTSTSSLAVYRFYNRTNGAHFFTASSAERDALRANNPELTYEGAMFSGIGSSSSGATSVYRFYNTRNGTHFYTVDTTERDYIIASLAGTYNYEGVAYQAYSASAGASITGATALYRFYNRTLGSHFFTASALERDSVIANLGATYNYEGTAYYVASSTDSSGGLPAPVTTSITTADTATRGINGSGQTADTPACGCPACRGLRQPTGFDWNGGQDGTSSVAGDYTGWSGTLTGGTAVAEATAPPNGASDPWYRLRPAHDALALSQA